MKFEFQGMFFHPEDRGEMASMVYNWPADEVDPIDHHHHHHHHQHHRSQRHYLDLDL